MSETPETESAAAAAPGRAPGEILHQAREGKNLSVAAIATQLNLDLRTVEALERGEHDRLPAPIFVRGYLRGYARLVGVSEDEVLNAYRAHAPQPEPVPRPIGAGGAVVTRRRPALSVPRLPWRGLFIAALLIAAAALAFVYGPRLVMPLLTGSGAAPEQAATPSALPLPAPAGGAAAGDGAAPVSGVSGQLDLPLPAPLPVPAEAPPAPADQEPEPEFPAAEDFAPAAAVAPEPAAVPEPAAAPVEPATPGQVRLEFRFQDDSWVEVRGADRARLLFGLMRKGDTRSVSGKPPVSVLLGNAQAVELRVDGTRFDPAPHTRNNVARFQIRAAN